MGTNWSSLEHEPSSDPWWPAPQPSSHTAQSSVDKEGMPEVYNKSHGKVKEEELDAFKQELAQKRAMRHEALAALQSEMRDLRMKVEEQTELRQKAEEERDQMRNSTSEELQKELEKEREEKKKLLEERDQLKEEVEEKQGLERQVQALKDVSQIGKEMLRIRELQVKELKKNLVEINLKSFMAPPEDLRMEYEKQIENIRKLRTLYDERAAATLLKHKQELEREEAKITVLETKLSEMKKETEDYKEAKSELEEKIENLEKMIELRNEELEETKDKLFSCTAQNQSLNSQMTLINNLFSQMIVSPKVDLDRLVRLLKDNHGLITDVTEKGDANDVTALLVDLAQQVEREQKADNPPDNVKNIESQSEIACNLSKVWKVMVELLSHHQNSSHAETAGGSESCYKCIQTPSGPRSVISVSKTFLTLKDLILEKNRLVNEVGRLKTLNSHLEHRLGSQEMRLSVVTSELKKTWGIVNKLKAQHKQLHTHEKILRYELQQKRCMLTELKEELEHCRDKWDRARQKNSQTEEDWKQLRKEFAARKSRQESNSAESGYEEEDVAHSPSLSEMSQQRDYYDIRQKDNDELSEEEIEHSDGNSFDTVIDLLDISCLENQEELEIPFALTEVSLQPIEVLPGILPLTSSEFTDGLVQIESEDLAAVLDVQYQNQLIGANYNLSLPSSSSSSPIPHENDDLTSSEIDMSGEESSTHDNHILPTHSSVTNNKTSDDPFLFGSNSSKNVSKFLEGLFEEEQPIENMPNECQKLTLEVPTSSQLIDDNETTPIVNNNISCEFPINSTIKLVCNETIQEASESIDMVTPISSIDNALSGENTYREVSHSPSQVDLVKKLEVVATGTSKIENNSQEQVLKAREEKLKTLEKNCRALVNKVMSTSFRNDIISNSLDNSIVYPTSADNGELRIMNEDIDNNGQNIQLVKINDSNIDVNFKIEDQNMEISSLPKVEQNANDNRTPEEVLEARAARLKRLEDQCKSLFSKMSATSSRSEQISNKLDELHESYGPTEPLKNKVKNNFRRGSISSEKQKSIKNSECLEKQKATCLTRDDKIRGNPSDLDSESKEILNKCCIAGPSDETSLVSDTNCNRTTEEILQARADRFKRLEDQCKSLVSKMTATSLRSEIISNKLDELHSCYGSSEDTSDNYETRLFSKENNSVKSYPTFSPKQNRKMTQIAEKECNQTPIGDEGSSTSNKDCNDRIELRESKSLKPENTELTNKSERTPEEIRKMTQIAEKECNQTPIGDEGSSTSNKDCNDRIELRESKSLKPENTELTNKSERTPEEILQARAQRLNRLEEQCKSLFSKMSATSQRSDVISNRLEVLHEQYSVSSENRTNERSTLPVGINSATMDYEIPTEEENAKTAEGGQ